MPRRRRRSRAGLHIVPANQLPLPQLGPRQQYPSTFEELWNVYPSRGEHTNSKSAAYRFWLLALRNGYTEDQMLAGAIRYKRSCDATAKTGTAFVMQAQRFLGRDAHFMEKWIAPAKGAPWEPHRYTPPPDERGEVPAGWLTDLLNHELRRHR